MRADIEPRGEASLIDMSRIVNRREGGVVEAHVPISLIFREDVPVDFQHVNDLADSILREEAHGKASGQLTPVLLGELKGYPQFRILDGFHRVGALAQLERSEAYATIR